MDLSKSGIFVVPSKTVILTLKDFGLLMSLISKFFKRTPIDKIHWVTEEEIEESSDVSEFTIYTMVDGLNTILVWPKLIESRRVLMIDHISEHPNLEKDLTSNSDRN